MAIVRSVPLRHRFQESAMSTCLVRHRGHTLGAVLLPVLVLLAPAAHAQKLSPGLWETAMTLSVAGADAQAGLARMQEQMAKMPPAQRKLMEDMLAKRGVAIGGNGSDGSKTTIRHCITPEQAARHQVPSDPNGRCTNEQLSRSGSTTRFKFTCTNPPSSGVGEVTLISDKAYTMKMAVDSMAGGKARHMDMNQTGTWVGADCGKLQTQK
jgi:hypothetical protein